MRQFERPWIKKSRYCRRDFQSYKIGGHCMRSSIDVRRQWYIREQSLWKNKELADRAWDGQRRCNLSGNRVKQRKHQEVKGRTGRKGGRDVKSKETNKQINTEKRGKSFESPTSSHQDTDGILTTEVRERTEINSGRKRTRKS